MRIGSAPAFGVEKYEFKPEEEGGAPDNRAGSHPFQLTTSLAMNQTGQEEPVDLPKNLRFELPPGLLGNPTILPQCNQADFNTILLSPIGAPINLCGPDTVVGVAEVTIDEPLVFGEGPETRTVPVFNLEPAPGEPARFGLVALKVPVVLDTAVRTGSDYGVVVTATNTDQAAGLISSRVAFWGVPGDPRHNSARGWACVEKGNASAECLAQQTHEAEKEKVEKEKGEEPKPFLSLPTSCGTVLRSPMQAQSWMPGAQYLPAVESEFSESLEESSCSLLKFEPTLEGLNGEPGVEPGTASGSTPTSLTVRVKVPQPETPNSLVESAVKSTTVTLPEGLQLNPAAAGGLLACFPSQIGFQGGNEQSQTNNNEFSAGPASCPKEAKVGSVSIVSPDLPEPLTGFVYLASQNTNPFEPPLVLYIIAEEPTSKVLVKLAGKVTPNPTTGQLVSTFENTPQVPFKELTLKFFEGGRASQTTPALCGNYATTSSFVPWSGGSAAAPAASFAVTSGPGGGPCPSNPLPFGPSFSAGSTNIQAGAFTPFSLTIARPDGQQALSSLTMHLPNGMAAMLSSLTPCPIAQADAAQCGAGSLIGHSTTLTGLGNEPFALGGSVYLTGPFDGAPFGLSVATPAVAGPFNLGTVIANSTLQVDRSTAAATINAVESRILDARGGTTIASTPLPTMIKGVPVQLKEINVTVDRPNFQFNPTSCAPMAVTGTLGGAQGGGAAVSSHFQVANCASLPFKPVLTATTASTFSKLNGASFVVKVTSTPGQANIAKTRLVIPAQLPSRLTTIQKACPDATFEANPATCDEGSLIGMAVVHTPVLKSPLTGPAYLVSHGGAAFPDVEFVLQGEGITLILDGQTNIHNGVTTSTFNAVPDAPVSSFEAILPQGPHSALAAYVPGQSNLCATSLLVPTTITGQNGAVIEQNTKVGVTGCKGVLGVKYTRAQLLARALKACKKKHNRKQRIACERTARKKYGPIKHAKNKGGKKK